MSRVLIVVFAMSVVTQSLAGCGRGASASRTADLGIAGSGGFLMWHDGGIVYYGDCPSDRLPVPANCDEDGWLYDSALEEYFRLALRIDRRRAQVGRETEVTRLKDRHPDVVGMRASIDLEMQRLATKVEAIPRVEAQISELRATSDEIGADIRAYDEQLDAVNQRLAQDPANESLLSLRRELTRELDELTYRRAAIERDVRRISAVLADLRREVASARVDLDRQRSELSRLYETLVVSSPLTLRLDAELADYDAENARFASVMALLRDEGLTYRREGLDTVDRRVFDRLRANLDGDVKRVAFDGHEGSLLVLRDMRWAGVCADAFDKRDGAVLCAMDGRRYVSHRSVEGAGGLWLARAGCLGTEFDLRECPDVDWQTEHCDDDEAVALTCS